LARAKRTDRAEVRRRYRADVAAQAAEAEPLDDDGSIEGDATADPGVGGAGANRFGRRPARGSSSSTRTAASGRVGFVAALRGAYQIADVRADVRALPSLLRGRSFILPAAASLVTFVTAVVLTQSTAASDAASSAGPLTVIIGLLIALFLGPLPIGSIYAAGTLAPRGSYLMGGIASFVGTVGYLVAILSAPVTAPDASAPTLGVLLIYLLQYTIFGAAIGAGLGFYRRLLRGMNPTAGQRPPSKTKANARAR
jgi:hypothetical protein